MATTFNDGAGGGLWSTPGNWTGGLPIANEQWTISANCTCNSDESAVAIGTGNIDNGLTLKIADGGHIDATGVGGLVQATLGGTATLDFECGASAASAKLETAFLYTTGAGRGVLNVTTSNAGGGALTVTFGDITLSTTASLSLLGTSDDHFTLDLGGKTMSATRAGVLAQTCILDYVDVSNGGTGTTYAVTLSEGALSLTNCSFVSCARAFSITQCNGRHIKLENLDIQDVTGSRAAAITSSNDICLVNAYFGATAAGGFGIDASAANVLMRGGAFGRILDGTAKVLPTSIFATLGGKLVCAGVEDNSVGGATITAGGSVDYIGLTTHVGGSVWDVDWQKWNSYIEQTGSADFEWFGWQADTIGVLDIDDNTNSAPTATAPFIVPFHVPMVVDTPVTVGISAWLSDNTGLTTNVKLVADPGGAFGDEETSTETIDASTTYYTLSAVYTPTMGTTGDTVVVPVHLVVDGNANGVTCRIKLFTVDGVDTQAMNRAPDPSLGHGWFAKPIVAATVPTTPTLAVANVGNGTTVTATITGGTAGVTYNLYYSLNGSTWTAGSTRIGNGNITQAGLTDNTVYHFVAQGETGTGALSIMSNLVTTLCINNATTGSDLEASLYAFMIANAGINAAVGNRVYPKLVPQDATMPAITYRRISSEHVHSMDGSSGADDARYQITCWGTTRLSAKSVANTVRLNMDGKTGLMGSVTIGRMLLEQDEDMPDEPPAKNKEDWRFGVRHDYSIWYDEVKPTL